jgi:hypothetical protein
MHIRDTKRWAVLTSMVAGLLLASCGGSSVSTTQLQGTNEVPPTSSSATGTATATLDGDDLTVTGSFSGLSSALHEVSGSAAHVHQAAAGQNGDIVFNLDVTPGADSRSGTFSGKKTLNDTQKTAFKDGLFYVNIHSENFPMGEIRGQFSNVTY